MTETMVDRLNQAFSSYPPVDLTRQFPYGTAGFRSNGSLLRHVMHRCGMLAVLRSFSTNNQTVGLCVTASHNPSCDNGVKLIDPSGGMLTPAFEVYATEFIAATDPADYFISLAAKLGVKSCSSQSCPFKDALILIGRDTRKSSPELSKIAQLGAELLGARVIDVGLVTTPQLHFFVQQTNIRAQQNVFSNNVSTKTAEISSSIPDHLICRNLADYYEYFSSKVHTFLRNANMSDINPTIIANGGVSHSKYLPERLAFDGANGIGSQGAAGFVNLLKSINVSLEIRNDANWPGDELNECCGAEFVQKEQKLPRRFGSAFYDPPFLRCCAVDGDADRLVYFSSAPQTGELILLDGDKIAVLYGNVLVKMLIDIERSCTKLSSTPLRIGCVQTAYANGASTRALIGLANTMNPLPSSQEASSSPPNNNPSDNINVISSSPSFPPPSGASSTNDTTNDVISSNSNNKSISCGSSGSDGQADAILDASCVKTGVKNLHHKAVTYDIGIYFESNGHGTVMFNRERLIIWGGEKQCLESSEFKILLSFLEMFNQATGDALTDILTIEMSLKYLGMTFRDWVKMYSDSPCVQKKVHMSRSLLNKMKPHPEHEKILLEPKSLQISIDQAIARHNPNSCSRAFVRPSGTEDVCRIYVEACSNKIALELCDSISNIIAEFNSKGGE